MGFNAVRLPFSVDTVLRDPPVADAAVAANPFLFGATALGVMDAVIVELGKVGVALILDNHMTVADWCCQRADCDGVWYHDASGDANSTGTERAWLAALTKISARYAGAPNVVAVEPAPVRRCAPSTVARVAWRPERVRRRRRDRAVVVDGGDHFGSRLAAAEAILDGYDPSSCAFPQWNTGPPELMYKPAMERGAAAVANANADVLIVVDALYYGRDLTRAGDANGTVEVPETRESRGRREFPRRRSLLRGGPSAGARGGGRLVYAVHDYSWYVTPDESTGTTRGRRRGRRRGATWSRTVPPGLFKRVRVNHASLDAGEARGESEWWRWFARYIRPRLEVRRLGPGVLAAGGTQVGGTSRRLGAEESYGLSTAAGRDPPRRTCEPCAVGEPARTRVASRRNNVIEKNVVNDGLVNGESLEVLAHVGAAPRWWTRR